MKGRRKELIKSELHALLKEGFGVDKIHSEYGMTELQSQAYSKGGGLFYTPPWMKVFVRDPEDALTMLPKGKSGGINVIDLANINSCAFIATQDLGKTFYNKTFKILDGAPEHVIASMFTFGREEVIPNMFRAILNELNKKHHGKLKSFIYYLDRHIGLDEDEHTPAALKMVKQLCENDEKNVRIHVQEILPNPLDSFSNPQ